MKLSEKNDLYISQKKEIERLKTIIEFMESRHIENDNVRAFCKMKCKADPEGKVKASTLYNTYLEWCAKHNLWNLTKPIFNAFVQQAGFIRKRGTNNNIYFYGISLKEGK